MRLNYAKGLFTNYVYKRRGGRWSKKSKDDWCWILRLRPRKFVIISESLAANLEKVRQTSVWQFQSSDLFVFFIVPQRLTLVSNAKRKIPKYYISKIASNQCICSKDWWEVDCKKKPKVLSSEKWFGLLDERIDTVVVR